MIHASQSLVFHIKSHSILGLYGDYGKENGKYYSTLGLYRDNGKENGSYYSILGFYRGNGKVETTIVSWGYIRKSKAVHGHTAQKVKHTPKQEKSRLAVFFGAGQRRHSGVSCRELSRSIAVSILFSILLI